jgi:O-antigen/teichoic acid export membrane protein
LIKDLFKPGKLTRTEKTKKNIFLLFLLHSFNLVFILLLVPLTLGYLGPTEYGIWLTLSSILNWITYLDFGIGNGLRNKLAESFALGDIQKAKIYASTAYIVFAGLILVLFVIFITVFGRINWERILNSPTYLTPEIYKLVFWVFTFFIIQIVLKLLSAVLYADQKPAINGLLNLVVNALTTLFIFILSKTSVVSIVYLGAGSVFIPVIVFLTASLVLFGGKYKNIAPSFKSMDLKYSKDLTRLGFQFFVVQISGLIVFATDNVIITQLFGPYDVTLYNISYRYFFIIPMIFSVLLTPFWSAYTDAFVKEDFEWIRKVTRRLIIIWSFLSFILVLMILISDFIYNIWVGSQISIPFTLSVVMSIFCIIFNWNNIFAYFLNGTGKIRLQFYYSIIISFINIPLSIYLASSLELGITGVMTATIICLFIGTILAPLQYYKIINRKDYGFWSK